LELSGLAFFYSSVIVRISATEAVFLKFEHTTNIGDSIENGSLLHHDARFMQNQAIWQKIKLYINYSYLSSIVSKALSDSMKNIYQFIGVHFTI
jgi:hypothetical protein